MNTELVKALDFFGLIPSLNSENEIKKKYKKLSMKYHPDRKGGDEYSFKLLGKYKDILEKNFEEIKLTNFSEYEKIRRDYEDTKNNKKSNQDNNVINKFFILEGKINSFFSDFFDEKGSFLFKHFVNEIYIKELYSKFIIFFLALIYLGTLGDIHFDFFQLIGLSLIIFRILFFGNIYSFINLPIYFGLSYYLIFINTNKSILEISPENSNYILIFYVFIFPLLWYLFFKYGKRILIIFFQKVFRKISKIFTKITNFIGYVFYKITNFIGNIIWKIFTFLLYIFVYIIPTFFFIKIENIIEPIQELRESTFYTLKILILYGIFLIIYTKLYKKYIKSDKLDTVDKTFYFIGLYSSLFLIINLIYFITQFIGKI